MKKRKISGLSIAVAAVLLAAAVGIGWFLHILVVRTDWKQDRLKLTACYSDVYRGGACKAEQGGEIVTDGARFADWILYNMLTSGDTVALRKQVFEDFGDNAIRISMRDAVIYISPVNGDDYTNVTWKMRGEWYGYTLKTVLPFTHIERAFENALRQQELTG